jgi:futalosine hydrolase
LSSKANNYPFHTDTVSILCLFLSAESINMNILVVAATAFEIRPFLNRLTFVQKTHDYLEQYTIKDTSIDVLIPGVGMMVTAFHMGRQFSREQYDLAINAGICGSYAHTISIGDVVEIIEDCVPELGAEDKDRFLSIFDLGLLDADSTPYINGKLIASFKTESKVLEKLLKVKGITVNTVHGNNQSIERVRSLFSPEIESMEGAAFLYACLLSNIPNLQIRAVSNFVEERDRSRWDLDLALKNLNKTLHELIQEIAV